MTLRTYHIAIIQSPQYVVTLSTIHSCNFVNLIRSLDSSIASFILLRNTLPCIFLSLSEFGLSISFWTCGLCFSKVLICDSKFSILRFSNLLLAMISSIYLLYISMSERAYSIDLTRSSPIFNLLHPSTCNDRVLRYCAKKPYIVQHPALFTSSLTDL